MLRLPVEQFYKNFALSFATAVACSRNHEVNGTNQNAHPAKKKIIAEKHPFQNNVLIFTEVIYILTQGQVNGTTTHLVNYMGV